MAHRATASWPVWVTAAALVTGVLTVQLARTPPKYTATVVLRVTQGAMRTTDELSEGALHNRVTQLTFTRPRLTELVKGHPTDFPGAEKDPDGAYDEIREQMSVEILETDLIQEDPDSDPPRSARISLSFTSSKPEVAWNVAHELADLLIDSALARQRAALMREQAGAASAVESAQLSSGDSTLPGDAVLDRLKAAEAKAANARLDLRAAQEQQSIRFEMVDPGRIPARVTRASLIGQSIATLVIALVAAALLAGAFDPRVIDGGDIGPLGLALLGRLPGLPDPPDSGRPGRPGQPGQRTTANPPNADPSPPREDNGPRV